ncbi:cell division protein FtsA [Maledivibacter halophilus]|uniref:Cell division protein FtsA n=1 Tax=Maledivibacter halophilus TaxID=36842 RepID=A0A1T5LIP3_9FIRM|nr:cell division FtsA domain-containing protein [Maledivibacter halophilus]SKC75842.1 cell division protein FtsA [Maledivibacter halophilus]
MGDVIFSLDIGTRSVVGILGKMEGEVYTVIDYEIIEHPDRAMYDGQIHDIEKVSQVAREVKERLEGRNGISLKYVSIAAAGRALKTQKVFVENEIDSTAVIEKPLIDSLELHGIQMTQKELEEICNDKESKYYCVGYTVVNYYLDDSIITNLKGHKGKKIGAEVLATFLPYVVIDSLYTVVHNVGLEVINLTLEPIAAINIAIPPKFRLLNLALVDIGAGTSDIAITRNGTISSYAMVSFAGDEITEAISRAFLLDFITAEKLKSQLNNKKHHRFTDIVGIEYDLPTEDIVSKIDDVIRELSEKIAEKIVENNGNSPSAVFCIGGGSQIPRLTKYLSEKLEIPKERVVVRGTKVLEKLGFLCDELKGPEFITPIGIGYTAFKEKEQNFLKVTVNDKLIRLFNSKQLSVADALLLVGFNARKLIAKKGESISIEVNGNKRILHGSYGEVAKIYLNGKLASLDTKIKHEDSIVIKEATPGKAPRVKLKSIVDFTQTIIVNGENVNLIKSISVNGEKSHEDYILKNNDKVNIDKIKNIEELMEIHNINLYEKRIFLNDMNVNRNHILSNGDVISIEKIEKKDKDLDKKDLNNKDLDKKDVKEKLNYIIVNVNGKKIKLNRDDKNPIFVEIFNYIDFDINTPKGILELKLNGNRASYTDILKEGDDIEIFWK